jgi:hypothetical protein
MLGYVEADLALALEVEEAEGVFEFFLDQFLELLAEEGTV